MWFFMSERCMIYTTILVIGTGHLHYSVSHFIHLAGAVPVANTMTANDLATQGARASAVMVSSKFPRIILALAHLGLINTNPQHVPTYIISITVIG